MTDEVEATDEASPDQPAGGPTRSKAAEGPGRPTVSGALLGVAAGLAVAVLVAALMVWVVRGDQPDPACRQLSSEVQGLGGIQHENGFTSFGPAWIQVLTDGIEVATPDSRAEIAVALRRDTEGFERFRDSLPDDLEPAATRLRALALDPDEALARRADDAVVRDSRSLSHHSTRGCGLAP